MGHHDYHHYHHHHHDYDHHYHHVRGQKHDQTNLQNPAKLEYLHYLWEIRKIVILRKVTMQTEDWKTGFITLYKVENINLLTGSTYQSYNRQHIEYTIHTIGNRKYQSYDRKHIEVHGRPTAAVFRSKPNTHQDQVLAFHNNIKYKYNTYLHFQLQLPIFQSYQLAWSVDSYSPIEEYRFFSNIQLWNH